MKRRHLSDATQVQRDQIDAIAIDFGAGAALSVALRAGLMPSRMDVERWCPTWRARRDGTTARLDSSRLAHEATVMGKYETLAALNWVHQPEPGEAQHELDERAERERARALWVEQRAAQLADETARAHEAAMRAQAEKEYTKAERARDLHARAIEQAKRERSA